MKKSFLAFLLLCFSCIFVSCSSLPHPSTFAYVNSSHNRENPPTIVQKIWIDNSFGEADLLSIQDALDQWTYALNGYMTFETEEFDVVNGSLEPLKQAYYGQAWAIMKINSTSSMLTTRDKPDQGTHCLAFTDRIGGHLVYVVRDRLQNEMVTGLVMHEIGHLLGAHHIDEDSDLMTPLYSINDYKCVDKHTLQQVAEFNHFPFRNMNYCVYAELTEKGNNPSASRRHSAESNSE